MEANASAEKLYKDVILIADPLQHLPFKLYLQQPALVVERSPTPPVVMKTHAATGQKSEPITGESEGSLIVCAHAYSCSLVHIHTHTLHYTHTHYTSYIQAHTLHAPKHTCTL